MAFKDWLNNIKNKSANAGELKELRNRLEAISGDKEDAFDYSNTKFFDVEPSAFNGNGGEYSVGTDQSFDTAALQRIYASETWVYVAVNAIAKTVAALPMRLEKKRTITKNVKNKVTGQMEEINQDVWLDASGEPLNARFQYPNPYLSRAEFMMLLMIDLLTAGEYYIYLDSDLNMDQLSADYGQVDPADPVNRLRAAMTTDTPVKGMYRIPPSLIKPIPSTDRATIEGYLMQSDHGVFSYHWGEIVHVKLPNPNTPFAGLSPLVASFKSVLLDRFSTEHIIRFYKAGARLGGVVETDKTMNKEQLARFQRSFESNYTGRNNQHRVLILPPGMKYNIISANPAESSLLDFCRYNREAILGAYSVPPIKVGIMDGANYANALVQLKLFFSDTIMPYLTFIEDGFNLKPTLMPATGQLRIKFDLSDVEALRQNYKEQAEAAKFMIDAGMSVNEVRERVWDLPPAPGGDKIKTIEDIKNGKTGDSGGGLFLAAPRGDEKTQLPQEQADAANISPIQPTKITFTQRVQELVGIFTTAGVPLALAIQKAIDQARLEGFSDETDPNPNGPGGSAPSPSSEEGKDGGAPAADSTTGVGTVQNRELIPTDVAGQGPKHPEECACNECVKKKDKKVPSLAEYITDALSKLNANEPISQDFINQLIALYKETYKGDIDEKETLTPGTEVAVSETDNAIDKTDIQTTQRAYAFGLSKEHITQHWKSFINKAEPLIDLRMSGIRKFFKGCERVILNKLGANLKAYGLHKARDNEDTTDILKVEGFETVIQEYIADIDRQLKDAVQYGYNDTLAKFIFDLPNAEAAKWLKQYGADQVALILQTTRDQIKNVLSDSFEEGVAIGEVSTRIKEKFGQMENGRAETIARTETLSAVAHGRESKRQDWQKQFPDQTLVKSWVSSQDDHVRDTHDDYDDGESYPLDYEYSPGLKYPHDEDCDDPSEIINCRCTDITSPAEMSDDVNDTLNSDDSSSDEGDDADEE